MKLKLIVAHTVLLPFYVAALACIVLMSPGFLVMWALRTVRQEP